MYSVWLACQVSSVLQIFPRGSSTFQSSSLFFQFQFIWRIFVHKLRRMNHKTDMKQEKIGGKLGNFWLNFGVNIDGSNFSPIIIKKLQTMHFLKIMKLCLQNDGSFHLYFPGINQQKVILQWRDCKFASLASLTILKLTRCRRCRAHPIEAHRHIDLGIFHLTQIQTDMPDLSGVEDFTFLWNWKILTTLGLEILKSKSDQKIVWSKRKS